MAVLAYLAVDLEGGILGIFYFFIYWYLLIYVFVHLIIYLYSFVYLFISIYLLTYLFIDIFIYSLIYLSKNIKDMTKPRQSTFWGQKVEQDRSMERPMVENGLQIHLRGVRFAAKGSHNEIKKNEEQRLGGEVITHASRPEGLANVSFHSRG